MADIGLSAFSVFFMGNPSFLSHQRALEAGCGRSNCQTLFGMTAIPTDAYTRLMLDGAAPEAFDPLFFKTIATEGALDRFWCLDGRVLIPLDGTEHFCSRKIQCARCSTRRRSDGGMEYFLKSGFTAAARRSSLFDRWFEKYRLHLKAIIHRMESHRLFPHRDGARLFRPC